MKQNNTKILKINNNKIIVEQGSEYGSLGVKAFKDVGKAVKDALAQTFNLIKTYWDMSFGYAINLTKGYYYDGLNGIKSANREFLNNNAKNISAMAALNDRQPGTADLNFFLGMTCPGALGFDKISSKVVEKTGKTSYGRTRRSDNKNEKEKYDEAKSKKALYNLIMLISHMSENTSLEPIYKNLNDSDSIDKKVDIYTDKSAIDAYGSNNFILVCDTLEKISKMSSKQKKAAKVYSVKNDSKVNKVLEMMIDDVSIRKITKHIQKNKQYAAIDSYVSNILSANSIDGIMNLKDQLFDNVNRNTKTLHITDKSVNIIEEKKSNDDEEEDSNLLSEEEFEAYKSAMEISFSKYYMAYSVIILSNTYYNLKKSELSLSLILSFVEGMRKEGIPEESKISAINSEINNLISEIKRNNKNIKTFNKSNKLSIKTISFKKLNKLKKDQSANFSKIKLQYDKAESDSEKEILKSQQLLDVIKNYSSVINEIDYSGEYQSEIEKSIEIYQITKTKILDAYSTTLEEHKDILLDLDIDVEKYKETCNTIVTDSHTTSSKIMQIESELKELTKKESELQSLIASLKEKQKEEEKEQEQKSSEYVNTNQV